MSVSVRILPALLPIACAGTGTAFAQSGAETNLCVTPYLWASEKAVDLTVRDTSLGAVAAHWPGGVDSALSLFGGPRCSGFKDKQAESRDGGLRTEVQFAGPMAGFNIRV